MPGATLLFCDVSGFSLQNDEVQKNTILGLNAEVTHELYGYLPAPQHAPSVLFLPTGDGLGIVLLESTGADAPAVLFSLINRLVIWSARTTNDQQALNRLRIGVHVGTVSLITDVNRQLNICGSAVNECQRVMDAAHAGQVLFSGEAYRKYVGHTQNRYSNAPFSATSPACFDGSHTIIAKHGLNLQAYVMSCLGSAEWVTTEPFPRGNIDGKLPRVRFIISRLQEVLSTREPVQIYERAAFSTFGLTDDHALRQGDENSSEYFDMLLRQRQLLQQIAELPHAQLRLILDPTRATNIGGAKSRCGSVLSWLRTATERSNVSVAVGGFRGPNRLIISGKVLIEGYKPQHSPGYDLSVVTSDAASIARAIQDFDADAARLGTCKRAAISTLEKVLPALPD